MEHSSEISLEAFDDQDKTYLTRGWNENVMHALSFFLFQVGNLIDQKQNYRNN